MIKRYSTVSLYVALLFVVSFLLSYRGLFAASDTFTVGITIDADVTAPSTPAFLSVIPVATSQMDIAWGTSTDDTVLAGYKLFRDGVQIATTTAVSYSDVGLIPAMLYGYTVSSYDTSGNVSISTALVSASTPSESSSGLATGYQMKVRLLDFNISTAKTRMSVEWSTNIYVRYVLRWGKTSTYELGFIQGDIFRRNHTTSIDALEPGTTYRYKLLAYNQLGREYVLSEDFFTTQTSQDITPPMNVSNIQAVIEGGAVHLSWRNPDDSDVQKIRIVRNDRFYPRDTADGFIVYQGMEESFLDADAFQNTGIEYYTFFAYDIAGNISSGVVISIMRNNTSDEISKKVKEKQTKEEILNASILNFPDIDFIQNTRLLPVVDSIVSAVGVHPILVRVPLGILPEKVRTIILTRTNDEGRSVSYLLRINKSATAFQTALPVPFGSATSTLLFSVYDYSSSLIAEAQGTLATVKNTTNTPNFLNKKYPHGLIFSIWISFLLVMVLASLLLYIYVVRKSGPD